MAEKPDDARFWDRLARKYAAHPVSDPAGYERTLERTRHYLSSTNRVLEFGCGTGTTALKLAPFVAHILASDISKEMIAIAKEKAAAENCSNATFEVATLDNNSWSNSAFDAVIGFNILHLLRDRRASFDAIRRVLKPGGTFISKTPCLGDLNPLMRFGVLLFVFFLRLTGRHPVLALIKAEDLEREIEASDFVIVERGYHGTKPRDARPFLVAQKS